MTTDDVHSALVRWLAGVTGVRVIKGYQGGPMPPPPYVAVHVTGSVPVREWPQKIEFAEKDTAETWGDMPPMTARPVMEMEWRFSVHAYGASPIDTLRPVVSASKLSQAIEPLFPAFVIHEVSQIRNVPDWINEQWQPRAQMDVILRGLLKDGHDFLPIEEVSLEAVQPAEEN